MLFWSRGCRWSPAILASGVGLFGSDGVSVTGGLAVRPVVYLQSGVRVDDLSISSSGSEEEPWTTTMSYNYPETSLEYGQITE